MGSGKTYLRELNYVEPQEPAPVRKYRALWSKIGSFFFPKGTKKTRMQKGKGNIDSVQRTRSDPLIRVKAYTAPLTVTATV